MDDVTEQNGNEVCEKVENQLETVGPVTNIGDACKF